MRWPTINKGLLTKVVRGILPDPVYRYGVRPTVRAILRLLFGRRGLPISVGREHTFQLCPEFFFSGYERFGEKHNAGLQKCIAAARSSSICLDIGAHIGLYTLPMSAAIPQGGCVYAFEPVPANVDFLMRHIRYNAIRNVRVHQLAVGDEVKDAIKFYEHRKTGSPLSAMALVGKKNHYRLMSVSQTTIDTFCRDEDIKPELIKIDVEGAEVRVLEGGRRVIMASKPVIVVSVHPKRLQAFGDSVEKLRKVVASLGYVLRNASGTVAADLRFGEYVLVPDQDSGRHP